jgi:hypothetical protein
MPEEPYATARIADLSRADGRSPIRREFDVQAFGVNAWTASEAGAAVIPDHDEGPSGHEELYVVLAGRATFTVAGDEIDAPTGTLVFVRDPTTKRGAVAVETNVDVLPLFAEGRYEEAKRALVDALGQYEDQGVLLYNLACAEARLGNADAAFEHLAAGLKERPDLIEGAKTDADLESLHADPRFAELAG